MGLLEWSPQPHSMTLQPSWPPSAASPSASEVWALLQGQIVTVGGEVSLKLQGDWLASGAQAGDGHAGDQQVGEDSVGIDFVGSQEVRALEGVEKST